MPEPSRRAVELALRIGTAVDRLVALGPAIAAAEPLPAGAPLGEGEDDWGPREVLAHVAEAVPYWHGEIERILAADRRAPAPFGRGPGDPARILIIERDRTLPATVLLARLAREARPLVERVAGFSEADLARTGLHRVRGPERVDELLERTLAGHLEGHVAQLRTTLGR